MPSDEPNPPVNGETAANDSSEPVSDSDYDYVAVLRIMDLYGLDVHDIDHVYCAFAIVDMLCEDVPDIEEDSENLTEMETSSESTSEHSGSEEDEEM